MPEIWLDRKLALTPWTACIYVSLYPLLLWQLWFWRMQPQKLQELVQRITWANSLASIFFVVYRTSVPRSALPATRTAALLRWIRQVDPPHNAFPSLHTTYAALIMYSHWRAQTPQRGFVYTWAGLIMLSTLTTKQHHALDVAGGLGLAWMVV